MNLTSKKEIPAKTLNHPSIHVGIAININTLLHNTTKKKTVMNTCKIMSCKR